MMDIPQSTSSTDPGIRQNFETAAELLITGECRAKAVRLLKRNIFLHDPDSMVLLGVSYADGNDEERVESIRLFREAADMGSSMALRNLGYCYAIGLNVPRDKVVGAEYYRQAMEAGNVAAATNLGVMYDYGNGVPQDFDQAFRCYTIAAEGGHRRGMTNLGEFYNYGKGTPVDLDKAEKLYLESGSPRALHRLALLYLDYNAKMDVPKGIAILKESADAGYVRAMVRYADEVGGDEAINYYNKAAAKGNEDAISRLGDLGLPIPEVVRRRK